MENKSKPKYDYPCTECEGNAMIGYCPVTIKSGKNKGKEKPGWGGLVLPGERLCTTCFTKRGGKRVF